MIPLIVAAAGAAVTAGGALAKAISGAQRARKMQDAIANYQRQDLTNTVRGNIGVSTLGADLAREEMARGTATSVDALASGGVRGMVGGIGRVQQANNTTQREIGADLDRQQQRIDEMVVRDDMRIREMQERREEADLAGMGRELDAARQDKYSGIGDIGQTLMSGGGMLSMINQGTIQPQAPVANPNLTLPEKGYNFSSPTAQINASLMPNTRRGMVPSNNMYA